MGDTIDYSLFLRDDNDSVKHAVAGVLASRVPQWKLVEFEKTPDPQRRRDMGSGHRGWAFLSIYGPERRRRKRRRNSDDALVL